MKTCTKCFVDKDESEFYKHRPPHTGIFKRCIECCKKYKSRDASMRWTAKNIYGISLEEYRERKAQVTQCPICLRDDVDLHLDHNKDTGKIRAFLCRSCNMGLGLFHHDADRLHRAAVYITHHDGV